MPLSAIESARERLLAEYAIYPECYLVGPNQYRDIQAAGGLAPWVAKLLREIEEAEAANSSAPPTSLPNGA